ANRIPSDSYWSVTVVSSGTSSNVSVVVNASFATALCAIWACAARLAAALSGNGLLECAPDATPEALAVDVSPLAPPMVVARAAGANASTDAKTHNTEPSNGHHVFE